VLTFNHNGPLGNFSVLSAPLEAPASVTIGGTALTGDQINVLFAGPNISPLTPAVATVTFGGVYVASDSLTLTFTNAGVAGLPITKTHVVLVGETAATVAAAFAALIQADSTLNAAQIVATANGNVLSVSQQGVIGNSTVITQTASGAETIVFDPSNGHMGGGSGQAGGVLVQVTVTTGQSVTTIGGNLVTAIAADADLAAAGITGSNASGVVTLTIPAAVEPVTVTSWVNTITPTATITGAVAAGDILNLTFTAAYLTGSPVTISHTALLSETTTTLATNLTAQINANAALKAAGITATSSTNVITFLYQANAGQIRFSQSVSPGSETITLTATPTDTAVTATKATETITFSPVGGAMSGGTGPIFAINNFEFAPASGGVSAFFYGQPYDLGFDVLTQMVAQGMPIV
jgi:hypothetical protein